MPETRPGADAAAAVTGRGTTLPGAAVRALGADLPQVVLAVAAFMAASAAPAALPWLLGFAVGALIDLVLIELLPEAYRDAPRPAIGLVATLAAVAMLLFQRYLWGRAGRLLP